MVRTLLVTFLIAASPGGAQTRGLTRAHAHNDYEHERPLLDALANGFNSVEVDVHLADGALLVGHDAEDLRPARTLERLYLDPLRERIRLRGGSVHPGLPPLLLLIDIKTDSVATYAALDATLRRYADIVGIRAGDVVREGPVLAVVSGNRPWRAMSGPGIHFAAYDGRLADLAGGTPVSATFMPLVSDRWDRITTWRGGTPFPSADRRRLVEAVNLAHAQGRRIRFWGAPEDASVWTALYEAGVDLINTDDLSGLRTFLLSAGGPGTSP